MGSNNTKTERHDEAYLRNLAQGVDTLRHSIASYPESTKRFALMLDSNEKKVQEVLRRSRRGSTRKQALEVLADLETLRARDSQLDAGAVESHSIVAGDATRYAKGRPRTTTSSSVESLAEIRRKVDALCDRIRRGEATTATSVPQEVAALLDQLDHVRVRPKSKLEACRDAYRNKLRRCEEQLAAASVRDALAVLRGRIVSLQSECETFTGYKDTPEYDALAQNLMQLWDELGAISDQSVAAERDASITLVSSNLKLLNYRCAANTRGSLSKNKILGLTELFHMQFAKIAVQVRHGRLKESEQVYRILREIHTGLGTLLDDEQRRRRAVSIYVPADQPGLKANQSCPNFACADDDTDHLLATLNREANILRYAVEEFDGGDARKSSELDERLIAMIIKLERMKGGLSERAEQQRLAIIQRVHAACATLKTTCRTNAQHLQLIDATLAHLEILKTQINESHEWQVHNPEFQALADALNSALTRLEQIESTDPIVCGAKTDAIGEVRQAVEQLNNVMLTPDRYAGTEV